MTCRHHDPLNNPACSSYKYRIVAPPPPATPDSSNYEILDAQECKSNLVIKVKYPNCSNCAFEGVKVIVYKNTKIIDALKWRKIDPHFRLDDKNKPAVEAPSPSARFPGNQEGWTAAIAWAYFSVK